MVSSKIILIIAVIIFLLVVVLQLLAELIDYREAKKEELKLIIERDQNTKYNVPICDCSSCPYKDSCDEEIEKIDNPKPEISDFTDDIDHIVQVVGTFGYQM